MFNDLREFLNRAEELGQVNLVEGADWNLEIGAITELQLYVPESPLLLFDKIKGYKPGYRVVTNHLNTSKLVALNFGLPLEAKGIGLVEAWREKVQKEFRPVPPKEVETGPVMENVHIGDKVDLFEFPTPKWHELDGGRYIGTADMVIQRDPDEGWVNLGTYRVQVHDKVTATIYNDPGSHGDWIKKKYWARGLSCPTVIVCGGDPLLTAMAYSEIPWGVSEYDYAGWLKDKPIEVVKGKTTDLPIPATAEIVLEGELMPPGTETRAEGPFGEWTGYYASGVRNEAAFKVKCIMHRHDPILLGIPHIFGPYEQFGPAKIIFQAGQIWNELDKQVPGVKGVWVYRPPKSCQMVVISVKQQYTGHAKQAAMFAAASYTLSYKSRFIIVVDDDIDPSSIGEVLWALGTRCDPETSISVIGGLRSSLLDPMLSPERRSRGELVHSMAIILACKPYHWIKEFPVPVNRSREVLKKTKEKWGKFLFGQV